MLGLKHVEAFFSPEKKRREILLNLEHKLGIENESDRAAEAILFVDPSFYETALIRNDPNPEEALGQKEWMGWLEARAFLRTQRSLSEGTIAHTYDLIAPTPHKSKTVWRSRSILAADTGSHDIPVDTIISQISQNPYLVQRVEGQDSAGFLYPTVDFEESLAKLAEKFPQIREQKITRNDELISLLMRETLQWLETAQASIDADASTSQTTIIALAVELRDRLVSIHPGLNGNGRVARLLMNWFLERNSLSPSFLQTPDQDLYLTTEEKIAQIEQGQRVIARIHERKTPVFSQKEAYFTPEEFTFIDLFFDYDSHDIPKLPVVDYHSKVNEFWKYFRSQLKEYKGRTSFYYEHPDEGAIELSLFVPRSFIQYWGDSRPRIRAQSIHDNYISDMLLFRGGGETKQSSPNELLSMFTESNTYSASYRAVSQSHKDIDSFDVLPKAASQRILLEMNSYLKSDYIQKYPSNLKNSADFTDKVAKMEMMSLNAYPISDATKERRLQAIANGTHVKDLITQHNIGTNVYASEEYDVDIPALLLSPFVSTSADAGTAKQFVLNERGVLMFSLFPRYGNYPVDYLYRTNFFKDYSPPHSSEQECSLAGGIDPNAIMTLIQYDRNEIQAMVQRDDDNRVHFYDFVSMSEAVYVFDESGKLELSTSDPFSDESKQALLDQLFKLNLLPRKRTSFSLDDVEPVETDFPDDEDENQTIFTSLAATLLKMTPFALFEEDDD